MYLLELKYALNLKTMPVRYLCNFNKVRPYNGVTFRFWTNFKFDNTNKCGGQGRVERSSMLKS